jgi:hypothetical protein
MGRKMFNLVIDGINSTTPLASANLVTLNTTTSQQPIEFKKTAIWWTDKRLF